MNNRYQVSEEFKQSCKENIGLNRYGRIHAVEDNLDIVGGNYDGQLVGFTIEDGCYVEDRFIGTTVAKKIIVNILNPDNILNLENKTIEAYAGIYINGKLEEIPYGNYIIEKPDNEEVKEKTSFTGYDYMIKFNIPYKDRVKYPIKLSTLFEDVCDQVGLEAGNIDFTNADYMVLGNPFTNGEDCRTVLSNIAQLAGGFAKIGRDNKAYIISLKKQSEFAEKITANNYFEDFSKNNQWGELNSLVIGLSDIEGENTARDDKESIEKNGLTEIKIEDNYLLINEEEREKVIEPLWENLKGLKYLPFKSKYYGYPYLDSGDSIAIEDTQEVQYVSFVFNHTFTFNGAFDGNLDIPAMTKTQTAYKNTQDIKSRIKRAERKIDKVNGQIEDVIKETTENSEKLSKHEQTIDSMKDTISSVETKVETVEKAANSASSKADSAEATANSAKESAENAVSQAETTTERLVEVEKNLDGITSTVSETVKKVETIEGKADSAQQTADTANKNAQNAQKSIETTNERVSKAEQTLDGFSQTVSSVQETLETTNAKFDNLEIGGTNLVSNLEINWEQGTVGEGASAGSTYDELKQGNDAYHTKRIRTKELIPIKNQFIISFNSGYRCCFALFDSNQHYLGITDGFSHWFTTSPTLFDKNASYIAIVFSTPDNSVITPSEIEKIKVKLELGNKPTGWSESPEDINQKFSNYSTTTEMNSAITQKANEITSKVSETYSTKTETTQAKNDAISSANSSADNKLKNYTNTTGMNSAIDKAKKEAEGNANNYTDGKLVNYSTTTQMNSAIKQSADSITSSVEKTITEKIDNIQVGGTNLVSNLPINWEQGTVGEGASAGSTYDELKQGNDAYHTKRIRTKELIPIKNQFIISFNSGYRCCFALFDSNQHYLGITDGFSHWFTTSPTLFDKNASYIAIVFSTPDNSVITPSEIEKIKVKLELGNKATDWTPAPEDTESKFENYYTKTETNSQIDQKSNQITSTVQQNITTAIDGIVIGGENLVSSLEANWEQGTLGEGANTGVTYDSVKTSNGSTTRIRTKDIIPIDSKFIVSFASGYRCCFCLFDANKKYLGQSAGFVNWFTTSPNMFDKNAKYIALCFSKDDGTSAISIKDVKNMKIKLELGTKSSGWSVAPEDYYTKSEIDQKDNQISLDVTGKVSDLEKTLNAKIDLKVDTKKLISEINASADQITLNSNRLIINSSYFTLDKNGKITATSGKIGGFTLDTTSFTGSLKGYYNYDVYDIQKLLAQCRYGDIDFPYCIRDLLDVVEDGNLNLVDASKMVDIINGKKDSDKYVTGTFKINSQNPKDCISILNGKEVIASLGLGGINAVNVSTGSLICGSTTIDDTSFEGTVISHLGIRTNKVFTYASNTAVIDGNANGVYFGQNANGGLITILRGGTVRLYAHNGGGVYLGASGSTAVTSDETQKDIYEIDDKYIEFFNKLKPITYIYKNKGHRNHIGFGARQVENALLESGLTTEQFAGILIDEDITISADEMGMEEDVHFDKLYSLRYEEFVALNTLKIQKQDKIIQKLIQRVEKLESEMI